MFPVPNIFKISGRLYAENSFMGIGIFQKLTLLQPTDCNSTNNGLLIKFLKSVSKMSESFQEEICNEFLFQQIAGLQTTAQTLFRKGEELLTSFSLVTSLNVGISPQDYLNFSLVFLSNCCKISKQQLAPVLNY